jgi:hypothetical protein
MFDFNLIPWWPWALVVAGVFGLAVSLSIRLAQKAAATDTVAAVIEATVYAVVGAFGGLLGGVFFSYVLAPEFLGFIAFALAAMCATAIVLGFVHGTANVGLKFGGLIVYVAIALLFVVCGILLWGADRGPVYVGWFSAFLAVNGAAMGIAFAIYRSAHWAVGWLLVFLNGSWGALGSLTGMLMHVGTWTFFSADSGSPSPGPAKVLANSDRKFFHCWQNGMRILPDYFFSQGPVMTAWTPHGMWHEAVHVMQHYVFGPIMLISYVAWAAVMGLFGGIVGLIKGNGVVHGAFAWAYVNNPWEVWEYNSAWGSAGPTPREVSGNVVKPGKSATDMIFDNKLAWPLTGLWIFAWLVGFLLLVAFSG